MILSSLFGTNNKAQIQEDRNASPRPDYPTPYGAKSNAGERVTVDNSLSIATAYRAKNIISDDVAKMPFKQYRRVGGNIEQVEENGGVVNMAYLLQVSPNQWGWTPFQFKKAVIEWQLFYGNAYIWKPAVTPLQLLILPANKTVPVFDTDGNLWYKHTFSNNKVEYIPAVEILHLLINPDQTGFMGRGVITFARETFGEQLAAHKTRSGFYKQGLNPAAYIQVNATLDKEDRKRYREAYGEAIGGTDNAYKLAVFDNKITKFEPVTMQPKDAQFLESIEANDVDIANFFGMPLHMLNRGKEAYNSNEQKYGEYLSTTLDSYLVAWEEAARIRWLSQAEQANTFFKFNRSSLLRMTARERAETNEVKIRSGTMTPNEARAYDDANPYPLGDTYYMTSNYAPIREEQEPQPAPEPQPEQEEEQEQSVNARLLGTIQQLITNLTHERPREPSVIVNNQPPVVTSPIVNAYIQQPAAPAVSVEPHITVQPAENVNQIQVQPAENVNQINVQPAENVNEVHVHPAKNVNQLNAPPVNVEVKIPKPVRELQNIKRNRKDLIESTDTEIVYDEDEE